MFGITACESFVEFHLVLVFLAPFQYFNGKYCCDAFSRELVIISSTNQVSDIVVSGYRIAEYTSKNHRSEDGEKDEVESQLDFETTKLIKQAHLLKTQTLAVCFEASNRSNDTNRNKLKGVHVMNHVVQGLNWYGGTRTYLHERSGGNRTYLHERS